MAWLLWYPRIHSKFTSPKFCFLWLERIARTWKNSICSSRLNCLNTSRLIRTHTKFVLTPIFPSVVKPLAGCFRSYHDTWICIDAISYIRIATSHHLNFPKKPFQQNLHRKLHQPNQPTNQPTNPWEAKARWVLRGCLEVKHFKHFHAVRRWRFFC